MDDSQKPSVSLPTPQTNDSLDEILASLEQQTKESTTPIVATTTPVQPPTPMQPVTTPIMETISQPQIPSAPVQPPISPLPTSAQPDNTNIQFAMTENTVAAKPEKVITPIIETKPTEPLAENPEFTDKPMDTESTHDVDVGSLTPPADEPKPIKKKRGLNLRMIAGAMVLLLLVVGSAVGYYLTQRSTENRQRASETNCFAGTSGNNYSDAEVQCTSGGKGKVCKRDGSGFSDTEVSADACGAVSTGGECSSDQDCTNRGYVGFKCIGVGNSTEADNHHCVKQTDQGYSYFVGCGSGDNLTSSSGCQNCYKFSDGNVHCYTESTSCGAKSSCINPAGSGGSSGGDTNTSTGDACNTDCITSYNGIDYTSGTHNCGDLGRTAGSGTCSNGGICCAPPGTSATDAPTVRTCGEACSKDIECQRSKSVSVCDSKTHKCVNSACPNDTQAGANCACTNTVNCGDQPLFGQHCATGSEHGLINISNKNSCSSYTVQSGSGKSAHEFCIPESPSHGYTRKVSCSDVQVHNLVKPDGSITGLTAQDVLTACSPESTASPSPTAAPAACWSYVTTQNSTLYWPDGCKGSYSSGISCTQALVALSQAEITAYNQWVTDGKPAVANCSVTPTPSPSPTIPPTSTSCLKTTKSAVPVCNADKNQVNIELTIDGTACGEEVQRSPLDVVIVFDRSSSMTGYGGTPVQPITNTKTAAKLLIDKLDPALDHVALVSFSTAYTTDKTLTTDFTSVKTAIDNIKTGGGTNLAGGIKAGTDELKSTRKRSNAKQVLIVITDGSANRKVDQTQCSGGGDPTSSTACTQDAINQAATAKSNGVTVYSVGVEFNSKKFSAAVLAFARTVMQSIASSTDKYYEAPSSTNLSTIVTTIAQEVIDNSAQNVVVTDVLPSGISYISNSAEPIPASQNGQTLTWSLSNIKTEKKIVKLNVLLPNANASQLVDAYPDSNVTYTDHNGASISVPFPETKVSPEECVIAPQCLDITKTVASPTLGGQVSFTCGEVGNATSYEFRYRAPGSTDFNILDPLTEGARESKALSITKSGKYSVQCRPCNSKGCSEYESL